MVILVGLIKNRQIIELASSVTNVVFMGSFSMAHALSVGMIGGSISTKLGITPSVEVASKQGSGCVLNMTLCGLMNI